MNNRLRNQRCYLAGAIDRVADRGNAWRDALTPFLESLGVVVINPLKKPTNIAQEDEETAKHKKRLKYNRQYDELSSIMKEIRSVDLRMVDISDFLVVYLDLESQPCGTLEEIFWANRQKKPIIIKMEQGKNNAPDWLFGTIPHSFIFDTWRDIQDYLLEINTSSIKNMERWCFFNL